MVLDNSNVKGGKNKIACVFFELYVKYYTISNIKVKGHENNLSH